MAYTKFEQTYVDAYLNNMYPDVEEEQSQDTMLAAGPTIEPTGQVTVSGFQPQQVRTDVQPEFGVARPIPQNKAQEALGYIGELLTKAGVQLDKVGIDIPVLGRISLKDLTVGESGKVLEDMALGFYPIEGAGGFISGTTRIKPDPAFELLNIAPIAGAAAKVAGKGVVKAGQAVAPKAAEMAEGYMRSIGGIADIVPPSPKPVSSNVSELGFYSAAKQAVDAIQQPKGTGDQFLKQIEKTPGVKPDEIKWTGLDEFLKSKKSVTKAEVQEYLDKNRVEVKEVKLGEPDESEIQAFLDDEVGQGFTREEAIDYLRNDEGSMATKFSKYTLPGGENYREILLTLPTNMSEYNKFSDELTAKYGPGGFDNLPLTEIERARLNKFYADEEKQPFQSQHFDQPNILAHLRVNDRIDADGKKVLFIEEVQSDWHQAGRKKGYDTPQVRQNIAKERQRLLDQKDYYAKLAEPYAAQGKDSPTEIVDGWTQAANGLQELQRIENSMSNAVPNAPFKTTWHELSMKRAIQLAAEGGYDRVAFTTGKTQAERYDLSKQVKMISAMPDKNGTYNIYIEGKNGDALFRNQNGFGEYGQKIVTPEEFEELVGKDAASTIMQKADELNRGKVSKDQYKFYDSKPADLTIGGEGMKGFYDQILPKFLDKYAKKWDAKTGQMNMFVSPRDGSVPINYIDVTPKMKESVLTKGQPLFAIGAGGAAVQQEDNQ